MERSSNKLFRINSDNFKRNLIIKYRTETKKKPILKIKNSTLR